MPKVKFLNEDSSKEINLHMKSSQLTATNTNSHKVSMVSFQKSRMNQSYQKSIDRNRSRIKEYNRQEDSEYTFSPNFVADQSLKTLQLYQVLDHQKFKSYA